MLPCIIFLQVCKIIEGQKYPRKLNEAQVRKILKTTCKRPREREQNIIQVYVLPTVFDNGHCLFERLKFSEIGYIASFFKYL